jgi:hypothetical protein
MLKPRSSQCYAGLNRTRLGHQRRVHAMTNLLEETINSNDANHAAKVIQEALGIESDDVRTASFRRRGRAGQVVAPPGRSLFHTCHVCRRSAQFQVR